MAPWWFRLLSLGLSAAALPAATLAQPAVVTSVLPVGALVAGVMEGIGTPTVIVRGGASPHSYALRPSDARLLAQARLVFWIGPVYESFLQKSLAGVSGRTQVVELSRAPGVQLLPARAGGSWESDHAHGRSPRPGATPDGHLHLDVGNAKAIVRAAAVFLGAVDQENGPRYRRNADRLQERLDALDSEMALLLGPVRERPFVVFHDAYQYLESRYDLAAVGSISVGPERQIGARRLGELRRKIVDLKAACVFSEPQFEPRLVQTLIAGTPAKTAVLDPVGADLPVEAESYFRLMRDLARALAGCLVE